MRRPGKSLRDSAILAALLAAMAVSTASAAAAPLGFVASPESDTVLTFSTQGNVRVGAPIPVGDSPDTLAITPDGAFAYVANRLGASVSVVNIATRTVVKTIAVGEDPDGVAIAPDGSLVYVSVRGAEKVVLIGTATNSIVGELKVQGRPAAPAVTPDGEFVYVPRAENGEGSIEVFNVLTRKAVASIPSPEESRGLVFTPDGRQGYFIAEEPGDPEIWAIETGLRQVTTKIPVGATPQALAVSPDGSKAYVALDAGEDITVIDTATDIVSGAIPTGRQATSIAITPDGKTAYVGDEVDEEIVAIDLATGEKIPSALTIKGGPTAVLIAPDQSPTAAFTAPSAVATLPAAFSGVASSDPDGTVAAWNWSFGDGGTASGLNVSHTFGASGIYATKLSVVDAEGCGQATVFTGQTAYCSGNAGAVATHAVGVSPPPAPVPPSPAPPRVCPRGFRIGGISHNRRNGTVRLQVKVPAAGALYLFGKKVHAVTRKSVKAGSISLTLHARVEVHKRLRKKHRIGVRFRVTFYPTAGCPPTTVHRSLALVRAPRKKHGRH